MLSILNEKAIHQYNINILLSTFKYLKNSFLKVMNEFVHPHQNHDISRSLNLFDPDNLPYKFFLNATVYCANQQISNISFRN